MFKKPNPPNMPNQPPHHPHQPHHGQSHSHPSAGDAPDPAFRPANPAAARAAGVPVDPAPEADVAQVSAALAEMQQQLDTLRAERDDWQAKAQHALADFSNYQRRVHANAEQDREMTIRGVVSDFIPVIDHFELALAHNPAGADAGQMAAGVAIIKDELLKVLSMHGVTVIAPKPNDAFDPKFHEAIVHQQAPGVEPGNVVATLRTGYALRDRVVRPAQVSVAKA